MFAEKGLKWRSSESLGCYWWVGEVVWWLQKCNEDGQCRSCFSVGHLVCGKRVGVRGVVNFSERGVTFQGQTGSG